MAIKRCYENQRRTFLERQPGKEDFCREQGLNRKYRSRRERVRPHDTPLSTCLYGVPHFIAKKFKRRTGVVTPMEMEKYWQFLDLYYMTEESDDPDNTNGIIEHKLQWRSKRKCVAN